MRARELIGAEWVEFYLENTSWLIPAGRMKMKTEHVVPLARQAHAIPGELKGISCDSRFVFPGCNRDKPVNRLGYKNKMTGQQWAGY